MTKNTTNVNKSGCSDTVKSARSTKSGKGSRSSSGDTSSCTKTRSCDGTSACNCGKEDCGSQNTEGRHSTGEAEGLSQTEFYKRLYKQAVMGEDSLKSVRSVAEERPLKSFFGGQIKAYENFRQHLEPRITALGDKPDGAPIVAKIMAMGGVAVNTLMDKSPSKLAEIVIQGANMGVIAVTKLLNEASHRGLKTEMADEMLAMYNNQIEVLKNYL